ncbi:MAG: nickel pincer cofactor biosynthesis protein LarC [Terriglobia bacterium]
MSRIAYLDCSSGISGDMFLAVLLDAGVPEEGLVAELRKLPLRQEDYEFRTSRVMRSGLAAKRVEIVTAPNQPARHLRHIEEIVGRSELEEGVKARALAVFRRLAEAEGRLHGQPPEAVHFHEVGALDAILDITGTCAGLRLLGISELRCSPLNVGSGHVQAAHGTLPVPAPATAELLKGLPVYSTGVEGELVTPTGAALVSILSAGFGPMPALNVEQIGYGAGARDIPGHPNIARLFVGERDSGHAAAGDVISVIQANIDDMNPQVYSYFAEQALAAGALDVTCTSIQMKKNRPGLEITVLCAPDRADALAQLLFEQTTTLGARIYESRRKTLEREVVSVSTPYGPVNVKVSKRDGRVLNAAPEYEDCARLAREKSVPLKDVMLAAQMAYKN